MMVSFDSTQAPLGYYFRFEQVRSGTGHVDEYGDYITGPSYVRLVLHRYPVLKLTPTGAWIGYHPLRGRFISRNWTKQWASPTIEEARQSFMARKVRQIHILESQLQQAREALELAKTGYASTGDRHYRNRERLPGMSDLPAPALEML